MSPKFLNLLYQPNRSSGRCRWPRGFGHRSGRDDTIPFWCRALVRAKKKQASGSHRLTSFPQSSQRVRLSLSLHSYPWIVPQKLKQKSSNPHIYRVYLSQFIIKIISDDSTILLPVSILVFWIYLKASGSVISFLSIKRSFAFSIVS